MFSALVRTSLRCASIRPVVVVAHRFASTKSNNVLLGQVIDQQTEQWENSRDAFRGAHQKTRWTYSELQDHTNALAVGFYGGRVHPGHSILAALDNDVELVATVVAAARLGATVLAVPSVLTPENLDGYLKLSKARSLLFTPNVGDHDNWAAVNTTLPELSSDEFGAPLRAVNYPNLKTIVHTGYDHVRNTSMIKSILVYDPLPSPLPKLARGFTGSTPLLHYLDTSSKLQTLTQGQYVDQASKFADKFKLTLDDRVFVATPLTTPSAHAATFGSWVAGASCIVGGNHGTTAVQLDTLLRQIADEYATVLHISPELFSALMSHPRRSSYDLSRITKIVIAAPEKSQSWPTDAVDAAVKLLPASIHSAV